MHLCTVSSPNHTFLCEYANVCIRCNTTGYICNHIVYAAINCLLRKGYKQTSHSSFGALCQEIDCISSPNAAFVSQPKTWSNLMILSWKCSVRLHRRQMVHNKWRMFIFCKGCWFALGFVEFDTQTSKGQFLFGICFSFVFQSNVIHAYKIYILRLIKNKEYIISRSHFRLDI